MVPIPQQQDFMIFLKPTKTTCLCTQQFQLVAQHHTTLPNLSLKFFKITVARLHPLLRIVQNSSRKLNLSINPEEETLVSFDVSTIFTSIPVAVTLQVINSKISTCTNFTNVCKIPTEKMYQASGIHYHQLHLLLQHEIL